MVCLIRGAGDIGSAVAHRLFRAGHAVVIHETLKPTTTRRGMAFADALFDGEAFLDGVKAIRADELGAISPALSSRTGVAIAWQDFIAAVGLVSPDVLVDARMRKRDHPEVQLFDAPAQ